MSQNFQTFDSTEFISVSYNKIIANFLANRSLNSGTSYPATFLEPGVPCWRTDSNELFIYDGTDWNEINAANAKTLGSLPSSSFLRSDSDTTHSSGTLIKAMPSADLIEGSLSAVNNLRINQANAGGDAFVTFNVSGDFAVHFGLDGSTNKLSVGGWSLGANSYAIYHEGNKPTPGEIGALGATENAVSATKLQTARSITLSGDVNGSANFDGTQNINIAVSFATSQIPSGTKMLFQQSAAPVGWTKDTVHNNKALRVVTGSVVNGGSVAFSTAFANKAVSGSVGDTTLAASQMPSHTHTPQVYSGVSGGSSKGATSQLPGWTYSAQNVSATAPGWRNIPNTRILSAGSTGAHGHSFSGTSINLDVQYVDLIIATKN